MKVRAFDGFLRARSPQTANGEDRTVEVTAATENPVITYSWNGEPVKEYVLMSGLKLPQNQQVPLCDSHDRFSVTSVLGSFRDMRIEGDGKLAGVVHFAEDAKSREAFDKVRAGHVTDFSIGFRPEAEEFVPKGRTIQRGGRKYEGPCTLITKWSLHELSICPIGADPEAKARTDKGDAHMTTDVFKNALSLVGIDIDERELARLEELGKIRGVPDFGAAAALLRIRTDGTGAGDEDEEPEDRKKARAKAKSKAAEDEAPEDEESEDRESEDDEEEKSARGKGRRALSARAERERIRFIQSAGDRNGVPEARINAWIDRGLSKAEASRRILEHAMADRNGALHRPHLSVTRDGQESFRGMVMDSIKIRLGDGPGTPAPGARDMAYLPFSEVARQCLCQAGQRHSGLYGWQMIDRALATTDLPMLLVDATTRTLEESFRAEAETWQSWTGERTVTDFKEQNFVSFDMDNNFKQIRQGGEYEFTGAEEKPNSVKISTYGRAFGLWRQALINDDLGALASGIRDMGQGAARLIGDLVYKTLTEDVPLKSDGLPLFCAGHGNLLNEADTLNFIEVIPRAELLMGSHLNKSGSHLAITPEYFIAPKTIKAKAMTFFASQYIGTQALPLTPNIFQNLYSGKNVYENRLDKVSVDDWYLVGARDKGVVVFYLNGNKTPYFEQKEGFLRDGVMFKCRIDVGVAPVAYQNFIKVHKAS